MVLQDSEKLVDEGCLLTRSEGRSRRGSVWKAVSLTRYNNERTKKGNPSGCFHIGKCPVPLGHLLFGLKSTTDDHPSIPAIIGT